MSNASTPMMAARSHPSLFERAAVWACWGMAGAIFLTVGWLALAPDDPQGAVSIFSRRGAWMMLVQAAGLAGVTAALATVIAGRRLPHLGTLAAGIGLAAASLRGESAVYLLLQRADAVPPALGELAGRLTIEVVLWFGVMLFAALVTELVTRWLGAATPHRERWHGWQHTLLSAGAGLAIFYVLGGGVTSRAIEHGQACFLVGASVYLAGYITHRLAPVASPLPPMLAVGLMGVAGYSWAWLRPGGAGLPANVPGSPFLRVLPIQFVSVGIAAAIAVYWHMLAHGHDAHDDCDHAAAEDAR